MSTFFKIAFFLLLPVLAVGQLNNIDSLKFAFINAPDGNLRYRAANNIYMYYQESNRDSALFYTEQQLQIARQKQHKIAEGIALSSKAYQLMAIGKYADALECLQQAFAIAENEKNKKEDPWDYFITPFQGDGRLLLLSYTHHMYALLMVSTDNPEQQIIHFRLAGEIGKQINYFPRIFLADMNLGQSYLIANQPDSALYYEKQAELLVQQSFNKTYFASKTYLGTIEILLGDIYKALKNDSLSLYNYYKSVQANIDNNNRVSLSRVYLRLSNYHIEKGNKDSAIYYSLKTLAVLNTLGMATSTNTNLGFGYENVYLAYKMNNQFDSAFKYQGLALITKDNLSKIKIKNLSEFQKRTYGEQLRLQNLEQEKIVYQNKIRTWFLLAGIGVLLLLAIIFYRNNLQKNKAKRKIEKAYDDLKSAQQQLIQSEKMASLGELTAGIAHEIQNPLNFVNNFSEINAELIEELRGERQKVDGERNTALEDEILNNIEDNEEKINHHGKRADAIVKGMLQHSRSTTGVKEPTDINELADEYVRLCYHGLRAKDKSFNAAIRTDFDPTIGKINIVPQDIGRVLLNLYNNAFYAVGERRKAEGAGYEPIVSINTRKSGNQVLMTVSDNGNGIPKNIAGKIFQPFFTTKPTGQGTGLGLSLSYDIINAHSGEIKVETAEAEGTKFIIHLPIR